MATRTMSATALCALLASRQTAAFGIPRASSSASLARRSAGATVSRTQSLSISTTSSSGGGVGMLLTRLFSAPVDEEVDPGVVEGTALRVHKYPHPALRATNAEITREELEDGSISKLAKEMFLVMYATEGVGLAAPQVGVNKRLMVYNESGDKKKWLDEVVMVNPTIVEFSEASDVENEGCLSFPNMNGEVQRSKWIKVEAQNLKGKKIKKKFKGWEARIFQHEYDHLDGVVYIDRLSEEGRAEVQPVLDELAEEFGEGGAL